MIAEFFGRFHPLIVHLPIGILLLAGFLLMLTGRTRYAVLRPAVSIILFIGVITAVFSCITGYLLSQNGEYEGGLVRSHQWLGIGLSLVAGFAWFVHSKKYFPRRQGLLGAAIVLLLLLTGHQGGSLTHGEDYLSEPLARLFGGEDTARVQRPPIPDIQEAMAYADVVQPILEEKCYACHGASKQKGKLRMDHPASLMEGGKSGPAIVAGNAAESEMIKRMLLPLNDEHHMAPKKRVQVTEQELQLMRWWIDQDADFAKKVKDLPQSAKIAPLLLALQEDHQPQKKKPNVPQSPVEAADPVALQQLRAADVVVLPVAQNSNYLSANFMLAGQSVTDEQVRLLLPIKKQLVWLKLGNTAISDASMDVVAQCTNLTTVHLDNTAVTDRGVSGLSSLQGLQLLNLAGTKVSSEGISALHLLPDIQSIYLYRTALTAADWEELKRIFPPSVPDSGGYRTAFLPTDTMKVGR